jgi:hypothetical protein
MEQVGLFEGKGRPKWDFNIAMFDPRRCVDFQTNIAITVQVPQPTTKYGVNLREICCMEQVALFEERVNEILILSCLDNAYIL